MVPRRPDASPPDSPSVDRRRFLGGLGSTTRSPSACTWCPASGFSWPIFPTTRDRVPLDPAKDNAADVFYPELTEHDQRLMQEGLDECVRVFRHIEQVEPGLRIEKVFDVPGYGLNHGIGTCRMGSHRGNSVVRSRNLRVHGFDNLMVIDTSVFPRHLSSSEHINITTLALKAAETILLPALGRTAAPRVAA